MKKLTLFSILMVLACFNGMAVAQDVPDEYIYFDLVAGDVKFSSTTYSGKVYVNGTATAVKGTHNASNKYYIYQSTGASTGDYDKYHTGYATTADWTNKRNCRIPNYPAVTYNGQPWGDYITNNVDVEAVRANWESSFGSTGRTKTGNRILFESNQTYNVIIDDILSSYEQTEIERTTGAINIGYNGTTAYKNCKVTLRLKGDNRVANIWYYSGGVSDGGELHITSAEGDNYTSGSLTVVPKTANYCINNSSCIGCGDANGSSGTSYTSSYRTYFSGGTVFAGMPKAGGTAVWSGSGKVTHVIGSRDHTGVVISGGRVTAVSNSTAAAIGGGGGYISAGGTATVDITGGHVYAYNNSIYESSYQVFVPCVAIGGSSCVRDRAELTTVNITGGNVYAQSMGGCAIGGGGSAKSNGGDGVVVISGGNVTAKSLAGSFVVSGVNKPFDAGIAIGGGSGSNDEDKYGGDATITITGGVIRAASIGGGSGRTVGGATVNISGTPDIQAQFVIQGAAASTFTMTGGEIHDSGQDLVNYPLYKADGGAVWMDNANGTVTIDGGRIYNNKAANGGAIYMNNGTFTMTDGSIENNEATGYGGGVYQTAGTINISGTSDITENYAQTAGGGVYSDGTINLGDGSLTVMDNNCANNTVRDNIHLLSGQQLTVVNNNFSPAYVGVFTDDVPTSSTPVAVVGFASPATAAGLQTIFTKLQNGTANLFEDRQNYSFAYGTASGMPSNNYLYLATNPWTPMQKLTTSASDLQLLPGSADTYEINSVKSLTAFLWYVNGITDIVSEAPFNEAHPSAKGKLTADINMNGQFWVPIGSSTDYFTGSLDGDGHTISELALVATNANHDFGLFGHVGANAEIKNLVLHKCLIIGNPATCPYVGSLASQMHGGTISNCAVNGAVNAPDGSSCNVGGLVGLVESGAAIHSSVASTEIYCNYVKGGLVGESYGAVRNCFANPKFTGQNSENKSQGGLVAKLYAGATIANCYVREQQNGNYHSNVFGYFVGRMYDGSIQHCYAPSNQYIGDQTSGTITGHGTYGLTVTPYQYRAPKDNLVTLESGEKDEEQSLVELLNDNISSGEAEWLRTSGSPVNSDYPLPLLPENECVYSIDGSSIVYSNDFNAVLSNARGSVWLYDSPQATITNNNANALDIFVDENVALNHTSTLDNVTVGITLDNSAGANGANPTSGGTDEIDWHFFSTSLSNAPLGINYTDNTQYAYDDPIPHYEHTGDGYFPTGVNDYYGEWDFYAYDEPSYHWINFKRNSNSHWNELDQTSQIAYTNESTLVPGKGYMVALADETLLQCTGELNQGTIGPIALSYEGTYRTGLNLLGNPYQSYLDFEAFATENSTIWSSETTPYYIVMDEDQRDYVAYAVGQSPNTMLAGRYLHPHQGFMVVTDKTGNTASFTNAMRVTDVDGYDAHFRGQQVAYPLVNLIATDANGNRDIATAELGRPDKGGAIVADFASLAKCLVYVHYDDKDYRIAFTQAGISTLPVRFEAFEAGSYTLTWSLENGEFSYMHLIDNIAGQDIDMLTTQEYTFTASTDDLKSRFKLVFEYTGIGEDEADEANAIFAYLSNGQLVVEGEGNLQIIDLNGRMLQENQLSGTLNTVSLPEMARGLYILKLNDKTQKIVM